MDLSNPIQLDKSINQRKNITNAVINDDKTEILKFKKMEKGSIQEKILQYLVSVEKLGQEIIANRAEIVMLDKRRNSFREAIRDLKKSGQRKCFITIGSVLVKHNVEQAISLLEENMKQVNIDINKLRSDLKVKVNDLRDLEMLPPVPGLSLIPLSDNERNAMSQIV